MSNATTYNVGQVYISATPGPENTEMRNALKELDDYTNLTLSQRVSRLALFFFVSVISLGFGLLFEKVRNFYLEAVTGKRVVTKEELSQLPAWQRWQQLKNREPLPPSPDPAPKPSEPDFIPRAAEKWAEIIQSYQSRMQTKPTLIDMYESKTEIFDGILIGNIQAFQSLDPRFLEGNHRFENIENPPSQQEIEEIIKRDPDCCAKENIRYVLSVTNFPNDKGAKLFNRAFWPVDFSSRQIEHLHIQEKEGWDNLSPRLEEIYAFLDRARKEKKKEEKILIHCTDGMTRSIAVFLDYLSRELLLHGVDMCECLHYLRCKRPYAGVAFESLTSKLEKKAQRDLEVENLYWKEIVKYSPPAEPVDDDEYTLHFYQSKSPIFDGLFLGGIQAYQSLDPTFISGGHRFQNISSRHVNAEQIKEIEKRDPDCCSLDNVQYVLSITNFPEGHGRTQFNSGFMPKLPESIKRLHIPVGDGSWEDLSQHFPAIFAFFDEARSNRAENASILVHCTAGMSRSATVLTAYLYECFKGEVSIQEILNYLKFKRPIVDPNAALIIGLHRLEEDAAVRA